MGDDVTGEYLKDLYYNLDNPSSYSSANEIYKAAKKRFPDITKRSVQLWLQKQPTATLHKPVRYKFSRNKTIVMGLGAQIQMDLCDMRNISEDNEGYNYILTGIDCFGRKGFAEKVKNKSGIVIASSVKSIFKKSLFQRLQTDKGLEFLNSDVKKVLKDTGTELWISENDDVKAALVERFNRTLKERMYKYFTANNTKRWIDVLPKLVANYNNTVHSSIKMKPNDVKKRDEIRIARLLYPRNGKVRSFGLKIGDFVRISKAKKVFRKGYLPNWSTEIFKIISRYQRVNPVYAIQDLNGEQIKGKFYEKELVKTEMPDDFQIEKIIRKKKERNGKNKYLVKWIGYDASFNSWVDESQMRKV